jgi:hypothetical protein
MTKSQVFVCSIVFFCHSEQREESPTKAFTEAEDALSKQLENQPKCEAEKPKLKFQIPKHKRWLYSVWYLEFGAWDFYVFFPLNAA